MRLEKLITMIITLTSTMVMGAFPQCQSIIDQCVYQHVGGRFGEMADVQNPKILQFAETDYALLCNRTNWLLWEQCVSECPLHIEITQPPEYRMRACVGASDFLPFSPDNHIDANHPMANKELEIVRVGAANNKKSIKACSPSDFDDKSYENKIAFLEHGDCYEPDKFKNAAAAKAAIAIDYNWRYMRDVDHNLGFAIRKGVGRGTGFENLPALVMPLHSGSLILEALNAGITLKGIVRLQCEFPPIDKTRPPRCPNADLHQICNTIDLPLEDQLCRNCSFLVDGGDGSRFCAYDNMLTPFKKETMIQYTGQLPFENAPIVMFNPLNKKIGCLQKDFTPFKGKIIFTKHPRGCVLQQAIIAAQRAGVIGYVWMGDSVGTFTKQITGGSEQIDIMVHSLDVGHFKDFGEFMKNHPNRVDIESKGTVVGYEVAVSLIVDTFSELLPARVKDDEGEVGPQRIRPENIPDFDWSATIIGCTVAAVVVIALTKAKIIWQKMRTVNSIVEDSQNFSLSLNSASMTLSLTLLLLVALTAFLLTHEAGRSSTQTARDDGSVAVDATYNNAIKNINELNERWINTILESAATEVRKFFTDGEDFLFLMASNVIGYDGTRNWLPDRFEVLSNTMRNMPWNINIKTTTGIYMDSKRVTDLTTPYDLSNMSNDPRKNYIAAYEFNVNERMMLFQNHITRREFDPDIVVGESFMDPFALSSSLAWNEYLWIENSYSFPHVNSEDMHSGFYLGSNSMHPISVMIQMLDVDKAIVGVVEAMRSISDLSDNIMSAVRRYPGVSNITTLLFDTRTGVIISSSLSSSREVDQFLGLQYTSSRESFSIINTYQTEVNALGSYLQSQNNGSLAVGSRQIEGEFDENVYYNHESYWVQASFGFNQGIDDDSPNNYKTDVRDGGCFGDACRAAVGRPGGGSCLSLDGRTTFYIYINLTTDTPRVAGTRVPTTDGSWKSSFSLFNTIRQYADGTEVVMYENPVSGVLSPVLREPLVKQSITLAVWLRSDTTITKDFPSVDSPRIFSDTQIGNAAVRWYANGRLYLGIKNFGCITDPIEVPADEWIHMIATIDQTFEKTCKVYINGELHSKELISPTVAEVNHDEPYRVGEYFKGMMDDFLILNTSISDLEANQLFKSGVFQRIVPSKYWIYTAREVTHKSISYLLGVMVPKEDVLRETEANNAITRDNLAVQEQNTEKKLDQKTYETIFVLVVLSLVSVLIFITFNDMLTEPFSVFAVQLSDAAVLKCDSINPSARYFITEMNALHKAMTVMVRNLKEYKSYMPATLLINEDDSDSESELTDIETKKDEQNSDKKSQVSRSTRSKISSRSSVKFDLTDVRAGMQVSLTQRKVGLAVVNVVDFHSIPDREQIEVHQSFLNAILAATGSCKGLPDTFAGDRMLISFNAAKPCAAYRPSVLKFLMHVKEIACGKLRTSTGAVVGNIRCGNIGVDRMKHYTCLSHIVTLAYTLERFSKVLKQTNVVDEALAGDASYKYDSRIVGWIYFPKLNQDKKFRLTTVMNSRKEQDNEEWMYQLENAAKADTWGVWNELARTLMEGKQKVSVDELKNPALEKEFETLFAAQIKDGPTTPCTMDLF
eukprot:TRINITY_DN14067_c0_g1_i2.p1 TRINITY_DN14067_c0_g1~~TRINITY_DN14067_c0_g1_i2.p1  ORF type:complete len:1619 (+),score=307.88 TRINITY_DN14067_c0_g1_i2:83-4858(+)